MYIYGDESGSFAIAPTRGSWCVVASYVLAEAQRAKAAEVLRRYKLASGRRHTDEVKRRASSESVYFNFLFDLSRVGGIAVAVATDSGNNQGASTNQAQQVTKLKAALTGAGDAERREIERLMSEMSALSPQLYVEYGCRLLLAWRTIRLAVLHFAERYPATLGRFCWVFDDKPPNLKALYRSSIPGFIQQLAEDEPLELLGHANHRHLASFLIPADVLKGSQRAWPHAHQRTYDAARMMTADVAFVDSTSSSGVQIADLIVGGLRACLRGEFSNNQRAAELLGSLFYDKEGMAQVVPLTYFTATDQGEPPVDGVAMSAVAAMGLRARRLRLLG